MKSLMNKKMNKKNHFLINFGTLGNLFTLSSIITLSSLSLPIIASPLEKLADQWYVGGSIGASDMNPDGGDTWKTTNSKDIGKKLYIGTDISRQIGLEAFWADFGSAKLKSKSGETGKVHYSAIGANVVYNSPIKIAGLRPIGKLGVAKFKNKDKGAVNSKQNNKLTVFGGIGAEFDLTKNLTVRSEYDYYDKDISQLSIGMNWSPKYRDHSFISEQNRMQKLAFTEKKPANNVINVYVPPQPKPVIKYIPKPKPAVRQKAKPRVVYKPAPAPQYKLIHRTLSGGSHFSSGSDQLTFNGKNTLNKLAQDLNNQGLKSLRIVGHTDSIGSNQANLSLSYARANSVAAYLASRGINRQLINTQGLGETKPVADNRTERGRASNRRVEITVKSATRVRVR